MAKAGNIPALQAAEKYKTRVAGTDRKVAQGILARSARDIPVAGRFALRSLLPALSSDPGVTNYF